MGIYKEGKTVNDAKDVHTNWVDESCLQTLEIKSLAGRLFSEKIFLPIPARVLYLMKKR